MGVPYTTAPRMQKVPTASDTGNAAGSILMNWLYTEARSRETTGRLAAGGLHEKYWPNKVAWNDMGALG